MTKTAEEKLTEFDEQIEQIAARKKDEILTMVDFHKRKDKDYPGYEYPTIPGTFFGKLFALHWATHAIIHSLWLLEDGRKVDCALFKDNDYCGIKEISIGDHAELFFQKANSGNVYLRGINLITRTKNHGKRNINFRN